MNRQEIIKILLLLWVQMAHIFFLNKRRFNQMIHLRVATMNLEMKLTICLLVIIQLFVLKTSKSVILLVKTQNPLKKARYLSFYELVFYAIIQLAVKKTLKMKPAKELRLDSMLTINRYINTMRLSSVLQTLSNVDLLIKGVS
jgi:hypothetical protein